MRLKKTLALTSGMPNCPKSAQKSQKVTGVVHKVCRLKGGGVKNCQFYLVKRQLRGGRGSKIADFETT